MKTRSYTIDDVIKETVRSNEHPSPELVGRIKSTAIGKREFERKRTNYLLRGLLAAMLCLDIGVAATAVATDFFGIRDLAVPNEETVLIVESPDGIIEEIPVQLISLSGFAGSPEHAAAVEWQLFLNEYDVEATLAVLNNNWDGIPEEYRDYGAYSAEMVAKIDEILLKYSLTLFGKWIHFDTARDFHDSIVTGPLFPDNTESIFMGYKFENGTFQFDGQYNLQYEGSSTMVSFQFRNSRKGVFDNVFLNVGDLSSYTEWNYESAFGMPLLLVNGSDKSLIIMETDNAFIVLNILDALSPGALEAFADVIDFSQLMDYTAELSTDVSDDEPTGNAENNQEVSIQ